MSPALELHQQCIAAVEQCPQFSGFEEGALEMVRGNFVDVAGLHEQGIEAVQRYWRNPKTIGGSLLWDSGYSAGLPASALALLESPNGT